MGRPLPLETGTQESPIDQSSEVFTQVSDLYLFIVCSQAGCGHMVYTNNLDSRQCERQVMIYQTCDLNYKTSGMTFSDPILF